MDGQCGGTGDMVYDPRNRFSVTVLVVSRSFRQFGIARVIIVARVKTNEIAESTHRPISNRDVHPRRVACHFVELRSAVPNEWPTTVGYSRVMPNLIVRGAVCPAR